MTRLFHGPGGARLWALPAVLILALPLALPAFDKPRAYLPHDPPAVAPVHADICDLFLLDRKHPVWIRLHVTVDGKPFTARRERFLDAQFNYLDLNRDGFLDAVEARRVPTDAQVRYSLQGAYYTSLAAAPVPMSRLDANGDGRVSRAELADYFRKMNLGLVRLQPAFSPDPYASGVSREIFRLLDRDGDGKLTRAELKEAERLLDKFDFDEDEVLVLQELIPNLQSFAVPAARNQPDTNQYLVGTGGSTPEGFAHRLLAVYDADKDFHLTAEELGLDPQVLARLDRDKNGKLDVPELSDWFHNGRPDMEAWLSIDGGVAGRLDRSSPRPGLTVSRPTAGRVRFDTPRGEMELGEPPFPVTTPLRGQPQRTPREQFTQIFQQVAGTKAYVDEADLKTPRGQIFRPVMALADRDGNGKLTLAEYVAYLELQIQLTESVLGLSLIKTASNWFSALDTNRDGRLSRRELRDAWSSLAALQPGASETLSPPDRQERQNLVVHRGAFINFAVPQYAFGRPTGAPQSTRGPLWFRKMDRNGDGYVSRREFLGGREDFDRMDRDGDGLIDPDEAERATPKN